MLWHCWLGHVTHKIVSEMTYAPYAQKNRETAPENDMLSRNCF